MPQIKTLAAAMSSRDYKANEKIIKYGDVGDEFFILERGEIEVLVYNQGAKPNDPNLASEIKFKKRLPSGTAFGELALMYGDKRSATVLAAENCHVWVMDGRSFKNIIVQSNQSKKTTNMSVLEKFPVFQKLDIYEKNKIIDGTTTVPFKKNITIIREGEEGDAFYLIEEGEVCVFKRSGGKEEVLRTLIKGDHFGEIALLKEDGKRTCNVKAVTDCKLLCIDRDAFLSIYSRIEDTLKMDYTMGGGRQKAVAQQIDNNHMTVHTTVQSDNQSESSSMFGAYKLGNGNDSARGKFGSGMM